MLGVGQVWAKIPRPAISNKSAQLAERMQRELDDRTFTRMFQSSNPIPTLDLGGSAETTPRTGRSNKIYSLFTVIHLVNSMLSQCPIIVKIKQQRNERKFDHQCEVIKILFLFVKHSAVSRLPRFLCRRSCDETMLRGALRFPRRVNHRFPRPRPGFETVRR